MKWNLVEGNEMGRIVAVVNGNYSKAEKKRQQLELKTGNEIVIYQKM